MKKLTILIFALLLTGSLATAQDNTSTVDQRGDENAATVNQEGTSHESTINQNTWGEGNTAVVNQGPGSNNFSDILQDQRDAVSYVDQVGSYNESRLKQSGPNVADIDQEGNYNILGQYSDVAQRAFQKNGTSFPDDMNWLNVDQIGDNNLAGTWQEHHAEATISQLGDWNDSRIYQSGSPAGQMNSASTEIEGNNNMTDIYQFGEGHTADIDIFNSSNNNKVDIDQFNGDGNRASYRIGNGQMNDMTLVQDGSGNRSHVQVLSGADNNNVDIMQQGIDNRGLWVISGNLADGNTLYVTSIGDGNRATGQISGGLNQVNIEQLGNSNWVGTGAGWNAKDGVVIDGSSNIVNVGQLSNGNMSVNTITGNNNVANVTQN